MPRNVSKTTIKRINKILQRTRGGGGVTCHDFGYGSDVRLESPNPTPFIYLCQVKNMTHSYTYYSENGTHSYTFFHILPIHILFE